MSMSSGSTTSPEPLARQRVYADDAGWRDVRPIFTKLYLDEGKTLKECMKVMEAEHGFYGT